MLKLQFIRPLIVLAALCGVSSGALETPEEPSNLTVKALGTNSFEVKWKDNSDNEAGWQIFLAVRGTKPELYKTVVGANLTSNVVVIGNELKNFQVDFQIRAYSEDSNKKQKFSKLTSISSGTTLPTSTFGAPTNLVVKTIDDGTLKITWKDNSTSETAYGLEFKKGASKKWEFFAAVNPGITMKFQPTGVFEPATDYSFRVRAVKSNASGTIVTKYSNIASAKTKAFLAPTQLSVVAQSDGAFTFKWKDNSSLGTYELQQKEGDGEFKPLSSSINGSLSSVTGPNFTFKGNFQFRMRGVRLVENVPVYTAFTNTVSIKATTIAKPEKLTATAESDYSVKLTWKDASNREGKYRIGYRKAGEPKFKETDIAAGSVTHTVGLLEPGTLYDFSVKAVATDFLGLESAVSAPSIVQARPKDGIGGDLTPPIFYDTSFSYVINASRASEVTSLEVTGLPSWLTYTASTRKLTGIPPEEGVKRITLKAKFKDKRTVTKSLVLRIIRSAGSPVITSAFDPVNVAAGNDSPPVPLEGKFSDPDTRSAARFTTTKGSFDIIFYPLVAPETVGNFLDYIDAGRYDNMFFHRVVDNEKEQLVILQGGGYTYTSEDGFKGVPKFMQETDTTKPRVVPNEPGISNVRGTVSMAKLPGKPNSATSEFFINGDDANAENLDEQNGGFTAFGRIPGSGMDVIDDIIGLPTKSYVVPGVAQFEALPMNATEAPATLEPDKLVSITGVTGAPILTHQVTSLDETVATAIVNGDNKIVIHGVGSGSTTVQVKATDLDGNMVSQDIAVTVP